MFFLYRLRILLRILWMLLRTLVPRMLLLGTLNCECLESSRCCCESAAVVYASFKCFCEGCCCFCERCCWCCYCGRSRQCCRDCCCNGCCQCCCGCCRECCWCECSANVACFATGSSPCSSMFVATFAMFADIVVEMGGLELRGICSCFGFVALSGSRSLGRRVPVVPALLAPASGVVCQL